MRWFIFIGLFLFASHFLFGQQESLYTQFMFNKQGINPAYVGNGESIHFTGIYRSQWLGLEGAPEIQYASASIPYTSKNIGIGLNLQNTTVGITSSMSAETLYAYKIKMKDGVLSGGIQLTLHNLKKDFSDPRLVTIDGIGVDPAIEVGSQNKTVFNTGVGMYYNTDRYYVGLSVPRLIKSSIDNDDYLEDNRTNRHFYLMGGYEHAFTEDISMMSQILWRYVSNAPLDVDINVYGTWMKKYNLGLSYRLGGDRSSIGESIDLILGMSVNENIYLGLAYDITLSKLRSHQSGSLEILGHYRLGKLSKPEDFINPRFF